MSQQSSFTENYLPASWLNKPGNVNAVTTLRTGGASKAGYSSFNLAAHVGDDLSVVQQNRSKLIDELRLPAEPVWLEQVHSNNVVIVDRQTPVNIPTPADASVTREKGVVCAVLTADCLPVFFCDAAGTEVAVAHAGWRGLHAGIISNTLKAMASTNNEILVNLGPAIGAETFEVGAEVFTAFVEKNPVNKTAFVAISSTHYLCDIYQLARIELEDLGVASIAGGGYCTYRENHRFYSFRREQQTGRMASLIWMT